jgi:hypothetical protein
VPLVVKREQLQAANSLLSVANSTAIGLGAAAGGMVAAAAGAGWAIGTDAVTFALSAALIANLRVQAQQRVESSSLLRDIREGWREFASHRWLWAIVAVRSMGGVEDWGWISAAFGAGLVCGGLVAMRFHIQRPMLAGVLCCFGLTLLPYLLIDPAPVAWVAAGGFVAGLGIEIFSVFWNTALHTHVAPETLSRVSAYDVVGSMALAPVGEALAGPLVASVGAPITLQGATLLIAIPTLIVLAVPEVRNLRDASVAPPV